jgi:hypothetical protein
MRIKIQLLRDDGAVVYEHNQDAFVPGGLGFPPGQHVVEGGAGELYGFTYLPVPPPRDPFDAAEFRRLYDALGGAGL